MVDDDGDTNSPDAPLWQPPRFLAPLIKWLRSPGKLAACAAASAASTILMSFLRRKRSAAALVGIAPVSDLLAAVTRGQVDAAVVSASACAYRLASGELFRAALLPHDAKLLVQLMHKHGVSYRAQGPAGWKAAAVLLVPFVYLGACGWLLWRMTNDAGFQGGDKDAGGNAGPQQAIGWEDVAGLPGVKAAVMEVVDVLRRPERYARLGARCPRGILLAGPPGTGKTLLARAIATEAGVPFLCCTGSDFVEVFVGRGAKRVRTLFDDAARRAPCVLFIDEIDALGSTRARGSGGNEEHDQTLNQLLAQMDGIATSEGVLVVGATNRLSALDPALTRPGRFDRVLKLSLPHEKSRLEILRVHARHTPLEPAVLEHGLPAAARRTAGLSGAELANVVNEAAISAVREGQPRVGAAHFEAAVDSAIESKGLRAPPPPSDDSQLMAALLQGMGHGVARAAAGGGASIDDNDE